MASMKSASHGRYHKGYPPTSEQKFHSREASLGEHDHVTAAIGDLYGDTDEEEGDYGQTQNWQQQQPQQQSRYKHSQTLPVTPPQTPTKGRKSPGQSSGTSPRSPHIENSPSSPISGSPTLRVPPNSPHMGGSSDANQAFPLNNLDYESNPEAVQQELENLQALRRMSMDVSNLANDPDLPAFNFVPSVAPKGRASDDDAASLFWVPARLHPELAPKAFKSFVESRVEQIREHEGNLSTDGLQAAPSLRRKKSMLSRQIDTDGKAAEGYEDGADILRRRNRSSSDGEPVLSVSELGEVLSQKDPADLMRQLSISKTEKALSGEPSQLEDDQPIFAVPPPGQALRRSTRTALRRGSIRKGERVAPSVRRAKLAAAEDGKGPDDIEFKLSRVQTEPIPSISISSEDDHSGWQGPSAKAKDRSSQGVEVKRQATSPPGLSTRPTSPPQQAVAERMSRSKSDPESPPPREPYQALQQTPKVERKEVLPQRGSSKDVRIPPPNGQVSATSPTSPQGPPVSPPATASTEAPAIKSKRPTLKRGSPGNSSYEPVKEPTPPPPAPKQAAPIEVKRKELPNPSQQQGQPKEVGRKSSWAWLSLGGDSDKDKDKEKGGEKDSGGKKVRKVKSTERDREKEEEKERKRELKREKEREKEKEKEREREREKANEREHARLDLLQKSIDGPKKRESLDSNQARPSVDSLEREREKEKEKAKHKSSGSEKDKDKKESGIFSSIFGGSKKKQEEGKSKSKSPSSLEVPKGHPSKSTPAQTYYYTRFPIHIERAIYRLSHLKLANPRRPLLQQVLLSNFMYAYLAKVQQMQPNGQPAAVQSSQQQQTQQQQQYHQQQQGAVANGDETQPLESDDEDYDFDDDGRDERHYDNQQAYSSRTTSRESSATNGSGYQQEYDGSYGYQDQYQQDEQGYYQQGRDGSSGNGNSGYSEKDYEYYQSSDSYDRRSDSSKNYDSSGNRYHHQRTSQTNDDRDYPDEMW